MLDENRDKVGGDDLSHAQPFPRITFPIRSEQPQLHQEPLNWMIMQIPRQLWSDDQFMCTFEEKHGTYNPSAVRASLRSLLFLAILSMSSLVSDDLNGHASLTDVESTSSLPSDFFR
jgi:hypothetical protein